MGNTPLFDTPYQAVLALFKQANVLPDVALRPAGNPGDALVIPAFVMKAFQFPGEVEAIRLGSGNVLDQRLQVGIFAGAGHHFGQYRLAAQFLVRQETSFAADKFVDAVALEELVVDPDWFE